MYKCGAARLPVDARFFGEASRAFDNLLEVLLLFCMTLEPKVE